MIMALSPSRELLTVCRPKKFSDTGEEPSIVELAELKLEPLVEFWKEIGI